MAAELEEQTVAVVVRGPRRSNSCAIWSVVVAREKERSKLGEGLLAAWE
jgi:hypothetical protein